MPALLNLAANAIFGAAVAMAVQRSPGFRRELFSWSFFFVLAFEALLFAPVGTYAFRFYPQWSLLYWFDPQIYPWLEDTLGYVSFGLMLLNFAVAVGSYVVTREGLLRPHRAMTYVPVALGAALLLWCVLAYGSRIAFVGDYDQFWQGQGQLFITSTPGIVGLLLYAATAGSVYWLHAHFSHRDPALLGT